MPGSLNEALPEVGQELPAIPQHNSVHRDNIPLPNHSNTRAAQLAEAGSEPETVAGLPRRVADL